MPAAWVWLPATSLFCLPIADSRSALSAVTLRWDDRFSLDAAIAADFPLVVLSVDDLRVEAGIEAGVWMGFDPGDNLRFDMETVDGTFAFPLSMRSGAWSGRLEVAHTSAHFADGVRDNGALPGSTEGYSREWLSVLGSRELGLARAYAGGHVLLHDQRDAPPFAFQLGAEVAAPWRVAPFAAADLQLADEFAWAPALSAQVGVLLAPNPGQRLRVAFAGRTGPDDSGKLSGETESWLGVTFGFDATGQLRAPP